MNHRTLIVRSLLASALVVAAATPAAAQAYDYPQFQPPHVSTSREFNFGLASAGDAGTVLLGQWREPVSPKGHLSFDLGFADAEGASVFFLGGQYGHQLATQSATMPLDFLLTIGAGFSFLNPEASGADNLTFARIPIGVSLGHRFPLEGNMAITPFVHPRLAFEHCGDCGTQDDSELAVDFDIGADFRFTPQLSMRFAGRLGGSDFMDENAFGVSLAWSPRR